MASSRTRSASAPTWSPRLKSASRSGSIGARRPQPQRVDVAAAPAGDRRVVGDGGDRFRRVPLVPRRAAAVVDRVDGAAEADRVGHLGPLEFPGVAGRQPVLGHFVLPAVLQHLAEDAVVVADAVAVRGNRQRGHALHEAGGEAPEAAVAERGVRLDRAQLVEIDAQLAQRALAPSRSGPGCPARRRAAVRSGTRARGSRRACGRRGRWRGSSPSSGRRCGRARPARSRRTSRGRRRCGYPCRPRR